MSIQHHNWRDCKAWLDSGLPVSTTSNEAAKMFDAALTQYMGVFDDDGVGGFTNSMKRMKAADPEFVLGHAIELGLDAMSGSSSLRTSPQLGKDVKVLRELLKKDNLSDRERKHGEAAILLVEGYPGEAVDVWQDILLEHPHDALALKFSHDNLFFLGDHIAMRDNVGMVLPLWDKSVPLYGYLHGLHAFGLVETNFYVRAEKEAKKGLTVNPNDAWSTHALAHVMEMMSRTDEAINWMRSTEDNWTRGVHIASHNYWHWALFHIDNAEYTQALDIFDAHIYTRAKSTGSMLALLDANSILYRLEMEGVKVGQERWDDVFELSRPHLDDHALLFNDVHFIMSCCGAKKKDLGKKYVQSLQEYVQDASLHNQEITKEFGIPMVEAFSAYADEDYSKAVDLANAARYKLHRMGGSDAQLDVFSQFLVHAAMKSPEKRHNNLCRNLIMQRQSARPDSKLNTRLMDKYLTLHGQ